MKSRLIDVVIIVLLFIFSQNILGQEKIYLDKKWKETTQEKASFYRIVDKKNDNLYHIEDYYINGNMQMDGYFSDLEKETLQGKIIWYDVNGNKSMLKNYNNGKLEGKTIYYLSDGSILSKGIYKDGEPYDGTIKDDCACPVSFTKYEKGKKIVDIINYKGTNQKGIEKYYFIETNSQSSFYNNVLPLKSVYYDKNNNEVGTLYYAKKDSYTLSHGTTFDFYYEDQEIAAIKSKTTVVEGGKKKKKIVYNKNGSMWLEGEYKDEEEWNGSFLIDRTQRNYKKGIQIGEEITYDDDLNTTLAKANFKNGKPYDGSTIKYTIKKTFEKGKLIKVEEYYSYYYENIKRRTVFAGQESQSNWYNEQGDLIGTGYTNNELKNGLYINGTDKTHYKDGKKNGIEKIYNYKKELKSKINYKNDSIVWKETRKPNKKDEFLHCDYKNDKPYEGSEFDYQTVEHYQKGYLAKEEKYDKNYKTDEFTLEEIIFYELNDNYRNTLKRIIYKKNKPYTLSYKEGQPYEGIDWRYDDYTTYKEGKKNGLFRKFKDDKLVIEGNYANDLKQGIIKYTPLKGEQTTCEFLDGQPVNGTVSNYYEKTTYKEGEKEGECYDYYSNIITKTTYEKGKKEGEIIVTLSGNRVIKGIYKAGKPYTGSFYDQRNYTTTTYFEEKKHGEFTAIDNILLQKIVYEKGEPVSEKTVLKQKDSLIGKGYYKNNKPYTGTFVKQGEGYNNYLISNYKKGQKTNTEIEVNIQENENQIIKQYNYKKGKKEGKYFNTNKEELPSFIKRVEGVYKVGKPYKGQFLTSKNSGLKILSNYKKGKKEGKEIYETSYNKKDSLHYKNGKIIEGVKLELLEGSYGGYYYKHYYKQGKRQKTTANKITITYNSAGFTINGDIKATVTFSDVEKTKGTITYYKNEKQIGFYKFNKNNLLEGNLSLNLLKKSFESVNTQVEKQQIVTTLYPKKEVGLYYKIFRSTRIPEKLSYKNYSEILEGFSFIDKKENMTVKQYLNDNTQITEFNFSEKKSYGVLIDHKEKKSGEITYSVKKFKKEKKNPEVIKGLTYEEMLKQIEK